MRDKLWTASVFAANCVISAQHKSSLKELIRRLIADDPIWRVRPVKISYEKRFSNKCFRNSLAIKAKLITT